MRRRLRAIRATGAQHWGRDAHRCHEPHFARWCEERIASSGEDERGGFVHAGCAAARSNDELVGDRDQEIIGAVVGERFADSRGWLLGRRTYEDVLGYWNSVPNSNFAASLNQATKYVATTRP